MVTTGLIIISGIMSGIIQSCVQLPYLSAVVYIPLFYSVMTARPLFRGRLRRIKSWHIFVFCSQLVSCSFLLTVYKLMPMPAVFGIIICAVAALALSLWLTFLICLPISFFEKIRSGGYADIISFAILYAIGEWLCENVPILSFPWSTVSLASVGWGEFIQNAGLLGGKFLTVITLCINGSAAKAIYTNASAKRRCAAVCVSLMIMSSAVIFGGTRIAQLKNLSKEDGKTINVLVAQDDAEGTEKSSIPPCDTARDYLSVISDNWSDNTDLILLPETAVPERFDAAAREFAGLCTLSHLKNVTICTGAFYESNGKTFNSIWAISPDNSSSLPYLKQVLVPFGEKIPFAKLFHAATLSCCDDEKYAQPIKTSEYTIGCGICIESIYPKLFRRQANAEGEFFIIPTNDSWFGKSFARSAHYRHSILRAVENQRYTLRSGNCGISAIISPWGEELCAIRSTDSGAITATIKTQSSKSLYTLTGDGLFISLCLLWLAVRFLLSSTKTKV